MVENAVPLPSPHTVIFAALIQRVSAPACTLGGGRGRKGRSGSIAANRAFPSSSFSFVETFFPSRGNEIRWIRDARRGPLEHALSASIHFSRSSARDTLTGGLRFTFFRFRYRDISPISSIFPPRIMPNHVFYSPLFLRNINLHICF